MPINNITKMFFMGILKKLTEEYFKETLRNEDGKFLDVDGCRVVVPSDFEERDFLKCVQRVVDMSSCRFLNEKLPNNEYIIPIEYKNNWYMSMYTFEGMLLAAKRYNYDIDGINDTLYNSVIEYLKHISKDVELERRNEMCIKLFDKKSQKLAEDSDFREKFKKTFVSTFSPYCGITDTNVIIQKNGNVSLSISDYMFNIDVDRIRHTDEMKQWIKANI